MGTKGVDLSRISKLLVDREEADPARVMADRRAFSVIIRAGAELASSRDQQLALLTAVGLANRCFPGAVRVQAPAVSLNAPVLVPNGRAAILADAISEAGGATVFAAALGMNSACILLGDVADAPDALRVTFDGWVAMVGPCASTPRLPERSYCALSPIQAAALAVSEIFMRFANVDITAGRRTVGLSLWRPDLDPMLPEALGVALEYLPASAWVLGLGHLGNAYLWALAALPYGDTSAISFFLNDFDRVEAENAETGVLFQAADAGRLKSRVAADWLEARGFRTRLVERRFDEHFRWQDSEPAFALCGFDNNNSRRNLPGAGFRFVVSTGLGGTATNFDAIGLNTVPNGRAPEDIWPADTAREEMARAEFMASTNKAYEKLGHDICGRARLAGKSVAVPFVGMTAACLAIAEALRLLHGGPKFTNLKVRLGRLAERASISPCSYEIVQLSGIDIAPVGIVSNAVDNLQ